MGPFLELAELLHRLAGTGEDTEDVEADLRAVSVLWLPWRGGVPLKEIGRYAIGKGATNSLAEGAALADGDLVTLLDTESRRDVGGDILVPLLVTRVLLDEVEVLPADDNRAVHLGGNDGASEDTAADRDEAGEGALLVCREMTY